MQILRNSQHPTESRRARVGVGVEAGVGPGASTGKSVELFFLHFLFIWCGCVLSWTDSSNMRQAERCHFDWQLDKRTQNARARFSKRDRAAFATIEGSTDPKIDLFWRTRTVTAPSHSVPSLCFDTHFTVPPRKENQNQNENENEK